MPSLVLLLLLVRRLRGPPTRLLPPGVIGAGVHWPGVHRCWRLLLVLLRERRRCAVLRLLGIIAGRRGGGGLLLLLRVRVDARQRRA